MMPLKASIRKITEFQVYTHGIDWGPGGLIIVCDSPEPFMILRNPGHKGWAGIGSEKYYETTYMLIYVYKRGERKFFEVLERRSPGFRWKACVKELVGLIPQHRDALIAEGKLDSEQ